jgi:hypothetical protein
VRVRGACRAKGLWKVTDAVPAAAGSSMWTQAHGGDTSRNCVADPVTTFSNAAAALQSDVDSKTARQMERASPLILSALGDDVPWRMQMATPRRKSTGLTHATHPAGRCLGLRLRLICTARRTILATCLCLWMSLRHCLPSGCAWDLMLLIRSRTRLRRYYRRSPSTRHWR